VVLASPELGGGTLNYHNVSGNHSFNTIGVGYFKHNGAGAVSSLEYSAGSYPTVNCGGFNTLSSCSLYLYDKNFNLIVPTNLATFFITVVLKVVGKDGGGEY
jgi:hypothetical protein